MNANTLALLTFGPLLLGAVISLAADTFELRRSAVVASVVALVVTCVAGIYGGLTVAAADVLGVVRVGAHFSALPAVIAACGALALLGGWDVLSVRRGGGTTAGLIGLGAAAAGVMVAATDLTTLLLALEVSAVISYALVSEARSTRSDEAAMKYFIQGSVATGFFVMGMAVIVGLFAPSGHYADLAGALGDVGLVGPATAGIVLVVAALAFKAGLAPLHTWAPDAYETAPAQNAAFLATGPKLGAIAALVLFCAIADASVASEALVPILVALSILSVLVGSIGALGQKSYRRMLAYAGIAQAGYALLGVAMLDATSTAFFLTTYALASVGVFLAADSFQRANPAWDGSIAGLAGMSTLRPAVSASVSVLLVSLAGIPPLFGFWGKFQVFATAVYGAASELLGGGSALLGWSLVLGVAVALIGSVISLGYYGSVLRALYLLEPGSSVESVSEQGRSHTLVVVFIAVAVVLLGVAPAVWGYSVLILPFAGR